MTLDINKMKQAALEALDDMDDYARMEASIEPIGALNHLTDFINTVCERLEAAEKELERERMRLAACGVVAIADTPDSAVEARKMHPDYYSASCGDVERRVNECISLRAKLEAAELNLVNLDYERNVETSELIERLEAAERDAAKWHEYQSRKKVLADRGFGKSPMRDMKENK